MYFRQVNASEYLHRHMQVNIKTVFPLVYLYCALYERTSPALEIIPDNVYPSAGHCVVLPGIG